jgi:site-specific recombinase XerD
MVRSGTDLRRLQLMLGHTSLSSLQTYAQLGEGSIREAYDAVAF